MKKLLILMLVLGMASLASADILTDIELWYDGTTVTVVGLNAIEYVESKGNINAIGDNGQAVGCMQIHPIMVKDVNRILGWNEYTLNDRYDRWKSRQMCRIYLYHYCKNMNFEDMAACWVAGPDGYLQKSKPAVKKYLEKINNYLVNLQ